MRRLLFVVLVIAIAGAVFVYTSDPLLWQRYFNTFFFPEDPTYANLHPTEIITGDGAYEIPVADNERSISDEALREVERYAGEYESHGLVVVHKGKIQTEWYKDGWDRDRFTQSQSMHKSLLPILIGAAMEDGDIQSIDEPIGSYISEWSADSRGEITIKQLMMMSSGLQQYDFTLNPFTDDFRWLFASNSTPVILRTQFDWAPGDKFDYNNINSEVLGLIIERATGKRYSEYLQEKLWRPLGGSEAHVWIDSDGGKAHTSCCLLATPRDWAKIGMLLLGEGEANDARIVSPEWVAQIIEPSDVSAWYGFQIWLGYATEPNPRSGGGGYQRTEPFLKRDTYYLSGFGAQRVYVVPSEELVIVRMGPSSGRVPIKPTWDNSYLVNTLIRGIF